MKKMTLQERKESHRISNRTWYYKDIEKTREKRRTAQKIYRDKNIEKFRKRDRDRYHKNIDKSREEGRAKGKLRYIRHREEILFQGKRWRVAHKEQKSKYDSQRYQGIKDKISITSKEYRKRVRQKVLDHYGNRCACCGETTLEFLCVDHIDGGGNKHRKELGKSGFIIYKWLVKNNFPEGYQLLCYNCNCAKEYQGICPHQNNKNLLLNMYVAKTGVLL